MASRREFRFPAAQRLIEQTKKPLPREHSLIELGRRHGLLPPEAPQKTVDWNDRALRALCAHEALLLNLGKLDEPIRKYQRPTVNIPELGPPLYQRRTTRCDYLIA
jgi:hypothetical protein